MKRLLMLSVLSLGLAFAGAAQAGTVSSTLNVSANLIATCTVTTTPVNFGDIPDLNYTYYGNGDVTVNCAPGIPYNIAFDAGQHYASNSRWLHGTTTDIPYVLCKEASYLNLWGDSDFANTFSYGSSVADTGTGINQTHAIYGLLSPSGTEAVGAYTDVVNVSVYY